MIQHITHGDYSNYEIKRYHQPYELICDQCGKVGVEEGTYQQCIAYAKKYLWRSRSIRTDDQFNRYLWSHLCQKCKKG